MRAEALALLDKARENLQASRTLIDAGFFSIAASRCYYAMFYAAQALLLDKGLRFASHGSVHAAFGREFVLSGRVEADLHRYLLDAFRARQAADYEAPAEVSREDALAQLERAAKFLASAEELLRGPAHHPAILGRLDYSHPVMEQNPARVTPRRDRIFPRFLYTPAYRPSLALFFCFPVFPQRQ